MNTKKVVVRVYAENHIYYVGDVVVEAPADMSDSDICDIIDRKSHLIPDPCWVEQDEEGLSINDHEPEMVGVPDNDEKSEVRLRTGKDGRIRVFVRKSDNG